MDSLRNSRRTKEFCSEGKRAFGKELLGRRNDNGPSSRVRWVFWVIPGTRFALAGLVVQVFPVSKTKIPLIKD
jgi:hypothetical protein